MGRGGVELGRWHRAAWEHHPRTVGWSPSPYSFLGLLLLRVSFIKSCPISADTRGQGWSSEHLVEVHGREWGRVAFSGCLPAQMIL